MDEPLISVVMSCYNASSTVDRAISSIINQSYTNFEFLIIDDGSTDNTSELLENWALSDHRIILLKNERNIGLAASLNKGVDTATGSWIARMDADDEALPSRFEEQISFVQKHPDVDILGTAIITRSKKNRIYGEEILPAKHEDIIRRVFKKTLVFHPTVLIRKSVFEKFGSYDVSLRWAEDADLWYRIYDKVVFHNLQKPLLIYTVKSKLSLHQALSNLQVKFRNLKRRKRIIPFLPFLMRDSVRGIIRMAGL